MKIARENIYFHAPYRMLLSSLDWIAQKKINCEIYADGAVLDHYTEDEIAGINSVFEKNGLKKIVHGPFLDLNPGSRDQKIKDCTYERFISAFEFCRKLKADHIVLHSGFDPIFYKDANDLFLGLSIPVWKETVKAAESKKITIALENSIDPDPAVVTGLLKEIKSPSFEACFDAGHYYAFGKMSPFDALKWYPDGSIGEIHLSDNKGDFDTHLPLGEGDIDFGRLLKEVWKKGRDPIITSEPHSREDIERNLEYLISLGL
jgi:sugar phosphate isomerase/epimerase